MTLVTQEDSDFTNIFRSSKNGFILSWEHARRRRRSHGVLYPILGEQGQSDIPNFQYKRIHLYNYKKPMYRYSGREKILITKKRRAL